MDLKAKIPTYSNDFVSIAQPNSDKSTLILINSIFKMRKKRFINDGTSPVCRILRT